MAAFGDEVTSVKEGDFVSAEMHVACGKCLQCRTGEAHICQNVKIIGVDADGAFAEYVVIPESNIWKLDPAIPQEYASILDPLGNAVHTRARGRNCGQDSCHHRLRPDRTVFDRSGAGRGRHDGVRHRSERAPRAGRAEMKADFVLDPSKDDVQAIVIEANWRPGRGCWCSKWQAIPTRFARLSTSCGAAAEFLCWG